MAALELCFRTLKHERRGPGPTQMSRQQIYRRHASTSTKLTSDNLSQTRRCGCAALRDLALELAARAEEIENCRRFPAAIIERLRRLRLFWTPIPRSQRAGIECPRGVAADRDEDSHMFKSEQLRLSMMKVSGQANLSHVECAGGC